MFISKAVKILCKDIVENNNKWTLYDYHFVRTTGISLWVANGIFFLDFSNDIKAFNIFEKIKIHKAIKKSCILKGTCNNKKEYLSETIDRMLKEKNEEI